jgi:ubiquinone/menaquinone biosynthesis C-methylase UbiE
MGSTASIETGQIVRSAAEIYEDFFVPALFQRWAGRVADSAGVTSGLRVLDVACGTGALTREVATRVGSDGAATGVDINPGMLEVAQRVAPSIEWRQGEAEALPFEDNSFDAVVSQFGLMFFRDRKQALTEMVRVLRPAGRVAVAVWDKLENTPGYAAASALLQRLFGAAIAESLRSPYALGDATLLKHLFDNTGLCAVEVETHDGVVEFPSIEDWMHTDVRGWTLADVLDDDQYALLLSEATVALREFVSSDGTVVFRSPAHIVSAVKC